MSNPLCAEVIENMADVLDGSAEQRLLDHIAGCDACRDARHDAERGRAGREKSQHAEAPRFKPAGQPAPARQEARPVSGSGPRDHRRPFRHR